MTQGGKEWTVALVHGIHQVIGTMHQLTMQACPGVKIINLLQEGIFLQLMAEGITPNVVRQIGEQVILAERAGAAAVLVTGSTFSPAVDVARRLVSIPVLKIDEAMAEIAVDKGERIGLIATEEATVGPSTEILTSTAGALGRLVQIVTAVAPEARLKLKSGAVAEHDALILEKAMDLDGKVDVIILAQASMYSALPAIQRAIKTPAYACPELAAARVRSVLQTIGWQPPVG